MPNSLFQKLKGLEPLIWKNVEKDTAVFRTLSNEQTHGMESFFGRMKCELLNLIARCPSTDTVKRVIDGYMDAYNNQHYQYALSSLFLFYSKFAG